MNGPEKMDTYLMGEALVGDDFDAEQIRAWFEDEREAYADLGAGERGKYRYEYHELNRRHGFRHLAEQRRFRSACGFGSAYGDELLPLQSNIEKITIIDSSRRFGSEVINGVLAEFVMARPDGRIAMPDGSFDLITCFGVLHHIPNVSFVVSELARCLEPGGFLLLREPTTSMGDWRRPRHGLTPRERGIPPSIFRKIIESSGLRVVHGSPCVFSPLSMILGRFGVSVGSHASLVRLDELLCNLTAVNWSYHRTQLIKKLAPASEFYVCTK